MECVLYASASYTPKNTGNFDLSMSTLALKMTIFVDLRMKINIFNVT
jgi:hypothetical protein